MKISKLFHWLYAILMFLPILVFIPNAFYYGFNEAAIAQEKTEQVPVYYETNEVNSITDLHVGNIYFYTNNFSSDYTGNTVVLMYIDVDLFKNQFSTYQNSNITSVYIYLTSSGSLSFWINGIGSGLNIDAQPFNFIPTRIDNPNYIETYMLNYIESSDYKYSTGVYQPLVTNMSITDSMSYAWKSTWHNELFSWTYDSFLTQPFLYITNLFNVPATNTLLYCLSYWLNISIIWLCFDVVMYVPLLVHRWLDKGIIE